MPRQQDSARVARKLGARIRALRNEANITQEKLAWGCGLNKGYLSQVEAGKRLPSVLVVLALARAIGVTPSRLFEEWK